MSVFKGSMEIPDPEKRILPAEEDAVLDKLAHKVVDRGWTVPAILFLESVKPLNFISAQTMIFFEPMVQSVFTFRDYDTLRSVLEKRESIEILLLKIEEYDAISMSRERRIKKYIKREKKNWKWYQRYLGIFLPKFDIPDEVVNPPSNESDTSS